MSLLQILMRPRLQLIVSDSKSTVYVWCRCRSFIQIVKSSPVRPDNTDHSLATLQILPVVMRLHLRHSKTFSQLQPILTTGPHLTFASNAERKGLSATVQLVGAGGPSAVQTVEWR